MSGSADGKSHDLVPMILLPVDARDVSVMEGTLVDLLHLKPLWERLLVGEADGRTIVGLQVAQKVSADSLENHARHLYSLLHVLGASLSVGPGAIRRVDVPRARLRPLRAPEAPIKAGPVTDDGLD